MAAPSEDECPITIDVNRDIRDIEQIGTPGFQDAYRAYLAINTEGKRFVSDGRFAKEDTATLVGSTSQAQATPVYKAVNSNASANSPRDRYLSAVWDEVVRGGSDPLHVMERDLQTGMYDAQRDQWKADKRPGSDALVDEVGPGQFLTLPSYNEGGARSILSTKTFKLRGDSHVHNRSDARRTDDE